MADPRRFVVTGCGRSGTVYAARLLSQLGCECGHEDYFGKELTRARLLARLGLRRLRWPMPPWGEVAWQAAPFLRWLPKGTLVFHQVRSPLKYMRSRQRKGMTYVHLRSKFTGITTGLDGRDSFQALPVEQQAACLARFWIGWNRLVRQNADPTCYLRYRIEDLDTDLVAKILERIGFRAARSAIEETLSTVPKNTNTRQADVIEVNLEMLPSDLYDELAGLAKEYGYDLTNEV